LRRNTLYPRGQPPTWIHAIRSPTAADSQIGRGVRRTARTAACDGAAKAATVETTGSVIHHRTCRLRSRARLTLSG
jgi:hypothetical protein